MKILPLAACTLLALPALAFASLGGTVDTVQSDQVKMQAEMKAITPITRAQRNAVSYTVHEMQLASGTTVREYVAPNGVVFGVAWKGQAKPDMQQVLGQYFDALSDPTAVKNHNHAQLHVQKNDLVVHASGHMRAFAGQAYLSSALPQGVTASDIQ